MIKKTHIKPAAACSMIALMTSPSLAVVMAPPLEEQLEEIVVSSAYEGRKLGETILGATVLTTDEIQRQLAGSIGETLRSQPGISSTFFGPAASRPVIRGLGGDRIRVLDNGLGSIDASATSPDHAVAVEPALAERIEILRGTAMLMYGSSAAGGVVNVMDNRIPSALPENGFEAAMRYNHSTVDDGDEITGAINYHAGQIGDTDIVLHLDGFYKTTDDYKIPGFAESELQRMLEEEEHHDEDEHDDDHEDEHEDEDHHDEDDHDDEDEHEEGMVSNTFSTTKGGSAGLSFLFEDGFFGLNVKRLDSKYGIPGHSHAHGDEHGHEDEDHEDEDHHDEDEHDDDEHHDEEEGHSEDEVVTIGLKQTRIDLAGELSRDFGFFKKAKFRFGYADYKHTEFEGDEVGTVFTNEGYESRLDLIEKGGENWGGATGLHIRHRDFSAIGAEAFVPPTTSNQYGIYSVKEFTTGGWQLDLGARFEHTKHTSDTIDVERSFNNISLSAGAGYDVSDDIFIGANVSRTERAPSTEELFSNGPHLATSTFEIGDTTLSKETATSIDATFSYVGDEFSLLINGFYTTYDNFIYDMETGEEEDELPVFQYVAADARFYGFEAKADLHAGKWESTTFGPVDFHLDGQVDVVRAKLTDDDSHLPRIPPLSALVGVEAKANSFEIRTELEYAAEQNRITEHELPTDDYLMWHAYLTITPKGNENVSFQVRAKNLTDTEARQHTSYLKDLAPLPGRNISLSMRMKF